MKRQILSLVLGLCILTVESAAAQLNSERTVRNQKALIHVIVAGQGKPIVLIPSLGRSAADFDDLSRRIIQAGYQCIRPQPRGLRGSNGPLAGITLHDLAADIAAVIDSLHVAPAIVLGHAFGARVAAVLANDRPELVSQLILLAPGSQRPTSAETWAMALRIIDTTVSNEMRRASVAAFFAKGNDPSVWAGGWYLGVAAAQRAAGQHTPAQDEQWTHGSTPILVLQGDEDIMTLSDDARRLAVVDSGRIAIVTIRRAGHAMLPEQPKPIADSILAHLRR